MEHFNPAYYQRGSKLEVWDFIRDQRLSYHLGCAVKYICRAGYKTQNPTEDLRKALHYIDNELQHTLRERKSNANGGELPSSVWRDVKPGSDEDAERFDR